MPPAWHDSPMMKAARAEPTDFTPIWLMRQAGRYMPEYRAIRREIPFLQLCKTPNLCAEIMLHAVEKLNVDAAILFSDLLLILEPMGMQLSFSAGEGPSFANPIRDASNVDSLRELENLDELLFVMEAVKKTRAGLSESLPLIGFAGAPFTLAAYTIEGGSSRDFLATKKFMYGDIGSWNALLGRLARAIAIYLNAQIAAGSQIVQLFDSWAGCLGPVDYRRFVMPHSKTVIDSIPPDVPIIHFATGNPALLPCLKEAAGDRKYLVIGADWRVQLDNAWQSIGYHTAIQGNLDPAVLLCDQKEIKRHARKILDQAANRPGHIFNLGHGVLPQTPVENAIALVNAVHDFSRR
jgi:uroporphyrinogen decarboxylase